MPIDLNDYTRTAAQRGWGPGWPSCGGVASSGLAVVAAPRSGVRVSVNRRIARLVGLLFTETENRGYLLRAGQCGGYNCLAGETLVMTPDGDVPIGDLAGTTARVLSRRGASGRAAGGPGRWVEAEVRSFGVQPLRRVVLSRRGIQREVYATSGHRWIFDEPDRARQERTTDELRPHDRLASIHPQSVAARAGISSVGVAHGIVHGDGTTTRYAPSRWTVVSVEPTDRVEEVFCAVVPGSECFALADDLLTGNCRAIAGTNVSSNHAWALAVDINSLANPFTRPRRTDMPPWMPPLWNRYGFAWGGNYNNNGTTGPADSMHYEFMGTPADADAVTALALLELGGAPPSSGKDEPVAVIPITPAADRTFRAAVMAETGDVSVVVARSWITMGATFGGARFTLTAIDGLGRVMLQRQFTIANNGSAWLEMPNGCKLATLEGNLDPGTVPAAALIVKPK